MEYDRGISWKQNFSVIFAQLRSVRRNWTIPSAYFRPPWKTSFSIIRARRWEDGNNDDSVERMAVLKRRFWRITFSQMVSPLLYFVTFRIGLGRMNDRFRGTAVPALPDSGLLSMTTMRNSYTSVSTRISVMRLHEKSFESYFYSPTKMYLLATGHILAGALRGLYSGIFILILGFVSRAGLSLNGW